jgi:hypothetical protein
MSKPIQSRPYSTAMACEACVFGRGEHAEFCAVPVVRAWLDNGIREFENFIEDQMVIAANSPRTALDRIPTANFYDPTQEHKVATLPMQSTAENDPMVRARIAAAWGVR